LLRRPSDPAADHYASYVIDRVGRPLTTTALSVAVYVPDAAFENVRNPLPSARSFDAVVEVAAEVRPSLEGFPIRGAYRVEERRLRTYPRNWPDDAPTPGVFLVSTVCRAASLDGPAFDAHWRDRHGPLALRHHVGMWDYRQSVVVERITPGSPPIDGIARLGFPSTGEFERGLFDSKEGRRALGDDTARFCDVERTEVAVLQEIVLRSPP